MELRGDEAALLAAAAGSVVAHSETAERDLLRFITCGSVDDGKSTLIGRLLYDGGLLATDELERMEAARSEFADYVDFASLLDGLAAEREQGITIDVAYRPFATARRSFIAADAPGHEQYTRNMVTGASTSQLAVILVDASKGVLTQTRRHSFLASLVGIRQIVLAVNKMDLVGYSRGVFDAIAADYRRMASEIGLADVTSIPLSGLRGDNVVHASANMPWFDGPPLLRHLEEVRVEADGGSRSFRMPVQQVVRPDPHFRGVSGTITSGVVQPGDRVRISPSGRTGQVARIVTFDGDLPAAGAGRAVTLTFAEELDCSRGAVVTAADDPLDTADQFEAVLVWMGDAPLLPGREYLIKIGTSIVGASISGIKHRIDINTLQKVPARTLEFNETGTVTLDLRSPVPFAPFAEDRDLGAFILIDRFDNRTIGAGTIQFALRRSRNIHWQHLEVDAKARAAIKHQQPKVLWFTGLSGAGKSTIANLVEKRLHAQGRHTFLLDGDNVRHRLNRDLGFTDADRVENIRRVGEVARLMVDAGLIVLTAFISPFRAERQMVREMFATGAFVEIFVDTPLEEAALRDPKGLYAKARRGELPNFTGIDSPYEPPCEPDMRIDTVSTNAEAVAADIVDRFFP